MAENNVLEIHVDQEVHVSAQAAGRKVVDSVRRQLRLPTVPAAKEDKQSRQALELFDTHDGQHHLAPGLLPRITETCRRQGIAFAVIDNRAVVGCTPLRSRQKLNDQEQDGVRQLSLRDNGALVAPLDNLERIVAEVIARRQQRTLLLTADRQSQQRWLSFLEKILEAKSPHLSQLAEATDDTRLAVGVYAQARELSEEQLRQGFGLVIFDGLDEVDAITLRQMMRSVGARYQLGLARTAARADGLQQHIFLALGGVHYQISGPQRELPLRLTGRAQTTSFEYQLENKSQYQALIAALAVDEKRNQQIAAEIIVEAGAGHSCLVLSERRDHLEALAALMPPEINSSIMTSTVRPAERARILEGFDRGEVRVLFCTSQIALESFSSTTLTRLFLTFPFASAQKLQKAVKCLLLPAPQQQEALIFDYDDVAVPTLHRAFIKRRQVILRLTRAAEEELARRAQLELPF